MHEPRFEPCGLHLSAIQFFVHDSTTLRTMSLPPSERNIGYPRNRANSHARRNNVTLSCPIFIYHVHSLGFMWSPSTHCCTPPPVLPQRGELIIIHWPCCTRWYRTLDKQESWCVDAPAYSSSNGGVAAVAADRDTPAWLVACLGRPQSNP